MRASASWRARRSVSSSSLVRRRSASSCSRAAPVRGPLHPAVEHVQRAAVGGQLVAHAHPQPLQAGELGQRDRGSAPASRAPPRSPRPPCRCATASSSWSAGCRRRCGRRRRGRARRRCPAAARRWRGRPPRRRGRAPGPAPPPAGSPPGPSRQRGRGSEKKAGLGRAGDHHVEVVPPARVLGQDAVEQERHHRVGVVAERVGEEEELLAAGAELVQRRPQLGVADDVAGEVALDLGLERPVAVDRVDGLADVVVEPGVVDRLPLALELLDHQREQAGLGQREERVDPGEPRRGEVDLLVAVEVLQLVDGERPPPVVAPAHVVVPVHLEDVAVQLVDDQAADHELGVVPERAQGGADSRPPAIIRARVMSKARVSSRCRW